MKQYELRIIIEKDQDGYFAVCPVLQGCYTHGDTYEEAAANIQDAIRLHITDSLTEGEEIPEPSAITFSTVHVAL